MKTVQLKSVVLNILFLLSSFFSFAQETPQAKKSASGIELTKNLYSALTEQGLSVEQQDLLPSDSTSFPRNLIISISAENPIDYNEKWYDSSINVVVFDFPQEYVQSNLDNFVEFIKDLEKSELSYECKILLSANNSFPVISGIEGTSKNHPNGTQSFTKNLGYDDRVVSLVISELKKDSYVIPGSDGTIAPLWLVRTIYDKVLEAGYTPNLTSIFPLLYSMNFGSSDSRISAFLNMGIPSAGIGLHTEQKDYDLLVSIAKELSVLRKENWDKNYLFFNLGEKDFWIPEAATVALFVLVSVIVLFIISFTGIIPTAKNKALAKDIQRTWFFYPIVVAIITIILHVAQSLSLFLIDRNPLLIADIKIISVFTILAILFIVQIKNNFRTSLRAQGFLMVAAATVNIFVYSGIYLPAMYFFVLEFLLFFISSKVKSVPALAVTLILSSSPFIYILAIIADNSTSYQISGFVKFSWIEDLLFALMLFPITMQIERIFIATDLFSPNKQSKKRNHIINSILAEVVIVLFVTFIYKFVANILRESTIKKTQPVSMRIIDIMEPSIRASVTEQDFMELSMRTLTIKSSDPVMRYEITIESESGVPVLESNYEYILEASNKISFIIPDFPDGNLEIVYSADMSQTSIITIQALFIPEQNSVTRNSMEIVMDGRSDG